MIWVLLTILSGIGLVGLNVELAPIASCRLSNGTHLDLRAITHGKQHHYVSGPTALRRLVSFLPADEQRRFGALQVHEYDSPGTDDLVFWFEVAGLANTYQVTSMDEEGNESDAGAVVSTIAGSLTPIDPRTGKFVRPALTSWAVPVYPRRGRKIGLRFWSEGFRQHLPAGEVWVPNPTPALQAGWTPSPLPAKARTGDLEVSLIGLVSGVDLFDPSRPATDAVRRSTRAVLSVREHGQPTHDWLPVQVTVSDATGNRWTSDILPPEALRDPLSVVLPYLWHGETAWKLQIGFIRRDHLPATDLWTSPRIRISGKTCSVSHAASRPVHGVAIGLIDTALTSTRELALTTELLNMPSGYRIDAIRATARGRTMSEPVAVGMGRWIDPSGTAPYPDPEPTFTVPLSGNPGEAEVTFAVQKPRFVEFTVKPDFLPGPTKPALQTGTTLRIGDK